MNNINIEKIYEKVNKLIEEREMFNKKIGQQIEELCKDLIIENSLFIKEIPMPYEYNEKSIYYKISFYNQITGYFCNSDERLIKTMKIDREDFKDQIEKFNGKVEKIFEGDYYTEFKTREDAEKALEWINSVFIMNNLSWKEE